MVEVVDFKGEIKELQEQVGGNNMEKLEKAIRILIDKLQEDTNYYYGWKANIAMAFYDEARREKINVSHRNLLIISNKAAQNFLKSLIKNKQ